MLSNKARELINILKTDKELKEHIERIRVGCWVQYNGFLKKIMSNGEIKMDGNYYFLGNGIKIEFTQIFDKNFDKILGQANYEDLLMFLDNCYLLKFSIESTGRLLKGMNETGIKFNQKKPLLQQEDEVLSELIIYLTKLQRTKKGI